ncbi:VOC family protein [Streptomyces sp. GC420]|uniref:VOC family protein n=1 Tax=Streptomyces sp. GC420 TaxID=2697568 RepID=UPI00141508E5|nr:VOC family protein [Streptomyces sp. GC420]NBM18250.1 VOC family protein [Streptomyces sp. GC420]
MSKTKVQVPCVAAAPCWVSLMARDLTTAQEFYGPLLGWDFEGAPDRLGPYARAVVDGFEVAGLGANTTGSALPVAWTTYFGTENVDTVAGRVRERGGTMAVGPLSFEGGRLGLAADPGGATFGFWQGETGRVAYYECQGAPVWTELRTHDPFAAALFYGLVFDWDGRDKELIDVRYENERVVLRSVGRSIAAITRGAEGRRPAWEVFFSVADTDAAAEEAGRLGGEILKAPFTTPYGRVAELRDAEGGRFSVIDRAG